MRDPMSVSAQPLVQGAQIPRRLLRGLWRCRRWCALRHKSALWLGVCWCIGFAAWPAQAQNSPDAPPREESRGDLYAIAIVNDHIVTNAEVASLARVLKLIGKRNDRPWQSFTRAALDRLINQRLQIDEAERLNLAPKPFEVAAYFENFRKRHDLPQEKDRQTWLELGILPSVVTQTARAELAWIAIVDKVLRPRVVMPTPMTTIVKPGGAADHVLLSEIFFGVSTSQERAAARSFAERLYEKLQQGADFSETARRYSHSATSSNGGRLEWLAHDLLFPGLAEIVVDFSPGAILPILETDRGIYLVRLEQRRTGTADGTSGTSGAEAPTPQAGPPEPEQQRLERLVRNHLDHLRSTATITIR